MIPLLESEFDQCLADELVEQADGFEQSMAWDELNDSKTVENENLDELETENKTYRRVVSVATGKSAAGLMRRLADKFMKQHRVPDPK